MTRLTDECGTPEAYLRKFLSCLQVGGLAVAMNFLRPDVLLALKNTMIAQLETMRKLGVYIEVPANPEAKKEYDLKKE